MKILKATSEHFKQRNFLKISRLENCNLQYKLRCTRRPSPASNSEAHRGSQMGQSGFACIENKWREKAVGTSILSDARDNSLNYS